MPPAILTPVLVSAAVGAVTAAVTGGNILKGALLGAVGGAIGGMFMGATSGAATTAAATAAESAATTAATTAATEAATTAGLTAAAEMPSGAFLGEAAWAPTAGAAPLDFGAAAAESATSAMGNVAAPTGETGLAQTATSGLSQAPATTGIGETVGQTSLSNVESPGIFNAAKDSSLASQQLGLAPNVDPVSPAVQAQSPTFLESAYERIFGKDGFLDKPGTRGLVGSAMQGMANGMNQKELLAWKERQQQEARQNARFGTQTSRFAPVGLVSTAKTPYKA